MDNGDEVLSQHAETEGFNVESGKTWIYPTNLPIRDYQYNIVNEALLKNTMVCLPTGLGKTFIAAVVMYNYFRWYPHGKIIFMAPTKPLVKQQVEACYNIMAIPMNATAELTGTTAQSSRDDIWEEKRVFFITPQVLQNDLQRITRLAKQIKCLVFDEAHKARGNHAYCEIIKKISPISRHFRVLALTATPGSNISEVVKVCNDLLISHIEVRSEDSADVAPFVFKKNIETLVVQLDSKLCQVRNDYEQVLDKYVRVLALNHVTDGNCSALTKGKMFYIKKEYMEKNRLARSPQYNEIMKNLNICLILYHAYDVLTKHGLRVFLTFFKEHQDDPLLKSNNQIKTIVDDVSHYLGPIPVVDMLPDGTIPEVPKDTKFGHPKFYKLAEILTNHFNKKKESKNNQVIVFCEYQESVMEAYTLLLMYTPLVKPRIFLGQGKMTQKQQLNVIQSFRSGYCNTLVSTSIGEEGLDIGDINLVVCFDISSKSSIRMIQRIGRTGRKQEGNVIMLVTAGKEQELLRDSLAHKDFMIEAMKTSKELRKSLYSNGAKMIPDDIKPVCNKIFITVDKPKQKLKNDSLVSMFDNMNENSMMNFEDRIPESTCYFNKTKIVLDGLDNKCAYSVEKNRILQSTYGQIGSSADSKILVSLLEFANSKRFNIPLAQSNIINKQASKNDNFKQSDIRTMFKKQQTCSQADFQESQDHILDDKYQNKAFKELQSELNEYLSMISLNSFNCNVCDNLFVCTSYKQEVQLLDYWMPPEMTILDSLTKDGLNDFVEGLKPKKETVFDEMDDDILAEFDVDELDLKDVDELHLRDVDELHLKDIDKLHLKDVGGLHLKDVDVLHLKDVEEPYWRDVDKLHVKDVEELHLKDVDKLHVKDVEELHLKDVGDVDAELADLDVNFEDIPSTPTKKSVYFELPKSAQKILLGYKTNVEENDHQSKLDLHRDDSSAVLARMKKLHQNTLDFFALNDLSDLYQNSGKRKEEIKKSPRSSKNDNSGRNIAKSQNVRKTGGSTVKNIVPQSPILQKTSIVKDHRTEKSSSRMPHPRSPDIFDDSSSHSQSSSSHNGSQPKKQKKETFSSSISIDDIFNTSMSSFLKAPEGETNKRKLVGTNKTTTKYNTNNKTLESETNTRKLVHTKKTTTKPILDDINKTVPNKTNKTELNKSTTIIQDIYDDSFPGLLKVNSDVLNTKIADYRGTSIKQGFKDTEKEKPKLVIDKERKSKLKDLVSNVSKNVNLNTRLNLKEQTKADSLDITDIFDSIPSNLFDDQPKPQKKVSRFACKTKQSETTSNAIKKLNLDQFSTKDSNKKVDVESNPSTSPVLSSYENNIRKSRLKLSQIRENNSPKMVNSEDIFADDFMPDIVNLPQSSKSSDKQFSKSCKSKSNVNTTSGSKMADCKKIHHEEDGGTSKSLGMLSPREKFLPSLIPKSVEKAVNVSQESDATLIISPETLSMFSEMRSPSKRVDTDDDDDFESPKYSSYSHKNKKSFKNNTQSSVKSVPELEDVFDFKLDYKQDMSANKNVEIPRSGSSKENHFSISKKKNLNFSTIKTKHEQAFKLLEKKKTFTHKDDTNKKTNFGDTSIVEEKRCEGKNQNTVLYSKVKHFDSPKRNISGKCLNFNDETNMEIQKYMDTLEWCKRNQSQYLISKSPMKPKLQSRKFNNSDIDGILQKYSSPNSKVISKPNPKTCSSPNSKPNPKTPGKPCTSPNSKSNPKTPGKSCSSPILKITTASPVSSTKKQKPSTSCDSPSSTKRCLTSPILSGKRRRKVLHDPDDDFEESMFVRPVKKKKQLLDDTVNTLSDDDFETSLPKPKARPIVKKKKKRGRVNDFLETEAALSSNDSVSSDESSGSSQDVLEQSFVNDTLDVANTTRMHAHYLQTVRSPAIRKGGFKIPKFPAKINQDIFSQIVMNQTENTYLEDSFCVGSDENEPSQDELSELEIAERILKEKKRNRRKGTSISSSKRKHGRIVLLSSDSD